MKAIEANKIYELDLHETTSIEMAGNKWLITRVASGWIYQIDNPRMTIPVVFFVPFDNKFQISE